MVCLLFVFSCQEPDGIDKLEDEAAMSLRTVDAKEVSIDFKKKNQNKSANWITPYFQFTDSIPLIYSNAQITVTPVITTLPDAYSRLFSIEIDGNLETVVYHMFANDQSTDMAFWGRAVITDLNGEVLSAWDVEDNIFTNYYDFTGVQNPINILNYSASTINKNGGNSPGEGNDGPCVESSDPDDWVICGPEVTITAPGSGGLSAGITIIFLPEIEHDDGGGGGLQAPSNPTDSEQPAAGANSMNEEPCPKANQVKCKGNCYDPCPDGYNRNSECACVKDICQGLLDQLKQQGNQSYNNKYNDFLLNLNNSGETGFAQRHNGTFYDLTQYGNYSLKGMEHLTFGYTHTHTTNFWSPSDINQVLNMANTAQLQGVPLEKVYGNIVLNGTLYSLKYSGHFSTINLINNIDAANAIYVEYLEKYTNNPLKAFLMYIELELKNNNFKIYKLNIEDESFQEINNSTGQLSTPKTNCNN